MPNTADLIITNAVVRTVDPGRPVASAFAVGGGRLLAVGEAAEVEAFRGDATEVRDLGGATVVPGLMDVHNHHALAGRRALFELSFPDTSTVSEIVAAVRNWRAAHPDDEWIVGGSWGSNLMAELASPDALALLDAAADGARVVLNDDSFHNRWANTAAMRAAGVFDLDADPEGGVVVRDADGRPTGVLLEEAGKLVSMVANAAAPMTPERSADCSAHAQRTMHAVGITGFLDAFAGEATVRGLRLLDERGELRSWAVSCLPINDQIFGESRLGDDLFPLRDDVASAHHRPTFAKIFLDGVPPARTGAFVEPYLPDHDHGACFTGHTTMPPAELEGWLLRCAAQGINVKIHCTGDAAVRQVLDAVAAVRAAGHADTIFHIAHGQFVHPDDLGRLHELGVVADISPALWFPGLIVEAIRAVRPAADLDRMQPNRSLADRGTVIAGGSDWPVAPDPNPWIGFFGLVTRRDPSGAFPGELAPDQRLTREEALAVYTRNVARALGIGELTGTLTPGRSADFVVLDRDPLTVSDDELVGTTALETWFEGERVYAAADVPPA